MYSNLNPNAIVAQYLIDLFKSDPLVNKIKFGNKTIREIDKKVLFPLVHIIPMGFNLEQNRINFLFDIACVSLRNTETSFQNEIFEDNMIDNMSEASAILIKALNILMFQNNEFDIEVDDSVNAYVIDFQGISGLDGYNASVVLSIQNEISTCNE